MLNLTRTFLLTIAFLLILKVLMYIKTGEKKCVFMWHGI